MAFSLSKWLVKFTDDEAIVVSANKGEPVVIDEKARAGKAYRNEDGLDIKLTRMKRDGNESPVSALVANIPIKKIKENN